MPSSSSWVRVLAAGQVRDQACESLARHFAVTAPEAAVRWSRETASPAMREALLPLLEPVSRP